MANGMTTKRLIIGCGYVGQHLAEAELALGHPVSAFVTSKEKVQRLCRQGINSALLDLDHCSTDTDIDCINSVIHYHVPPTPTGSQDLRLRTFLNLIDQHRMPKRLVLISTTGVYGDTQGKWVNEDSRPNPQTERAQRRLDAELALSCWGKENHVETVILRVPGIYGPGRTPQARLGNPVICQEEAPFSNRIHVADLVSACIKAATIESPLAVYNVSDNQPSTMTDYFNATADFAGLPRPPVISMAEAQSRLSPAMLSYLNESRRVDNRRMREHLRVKLRFPDLSMGLANCFQEEENQH